VLQPHDPAQILDDECHPQHPSVGFVYPSDHLDQDDSLKLLAALERIFTWILRGGRGKPKGILIRTAVVAWTILPEMFKNATQTELAAMFGLKDKQSIGREVSDFRSEFGYFDGRHRSDDAIQSFKLREQLKA